jgi:two-component system phosphate regulon sensor histidine kinase PhoR
MRTVWQVLGIAGAVALVLVAGLVGWRWRATLGALARGLGALTRGEPARPIRARGRGPVGRLARSFDEAAAATIERVGQLEQDRQQLRAVLSGMSEAVIAVDRRQRLLFANESADRLFELGPGAMGRLLAERIRSPQVQRALDAALTRSEPYRGEVTLTGRDALEPADARVLDVRGTRLPGSPPAGAVLVFHDVTELRRLERMRQDFVANVSHELKTPLASIKAYAETLLDGALHDDAVNTRFLGQIADQADRLDRLILDLLSLARLESGEEPYELRPVSLAPVVRASVLAHQDHAAAKSLSLSLEIDLQDEQTLVCADEEALRQIFDNLIDNAVKYTPEGGRVSVSCRISDDAQAVLVEVSDTGIGIPREDLPRVFERFYRVDKARSRELGGTGLGLSIVKHLVQAMHGSVRAASRLHHGTTFSVRLPRPPAP